MAGSEAGGRCWAALEDLATRLQRSGPGGDDLGILSLACEVLEAVGLRGAGTLLDPRQRPLQQWAGIPGVPAGAVAYTPAELPEVAAVLAEMRPRFLPDVPLLTPEALGAQLLVAAKGPTPVALLPLIVAGECAGLLFVSAPDLHEEELAPLAAFAHLVALALRAARASREQATGARLEVLAAVSAGLATELEVERVAQRAAAAARTVTGASYAVLFLRSPGGDGGGAEPGFVPAAIEAAESADSGPVRRPLFFEGQRQFVPDVAAECARLGLGDRTGGLGSYLSEPLFDDSGRVLGCLFAGAEQPRAFAAEDASALRSLAAHTATALRNAHLFAERAAWASSLEALLAANRAVLRVRDPGKAGETILAELARLVPFDTATIFSRDARTGELIAISTGGRQRERPPFRPAPGEGVSSVAARTGLPVLFTDPAGEPRGRHAAGRPLREAVVAVPLRAGERVLGVLSLGREGDRRYSEREVRFVTLFAEQAALALENARLYEESERRRREAERLAELGRLVSQGLEPGDVLRRVAEAAVELSGAHFVGVALPGDDGRLRYVSSAGAVDLTAVGYVFAPGEGYVGRSFASGQSFRVADLWQAEGTHQPELDRAIGARSFLAVPLLADGAVLGVITASSHEVEALTAEHEHLLLALAHHAAVALKNAALFRQAGERTAELEAVIEQMADAVLISDTEGRFLQVNSAAERLLGRSRAALLGLRASDPFVERLRLDGTPLPPEEIGLARALQGELVQGLRYKVGQGKREHIIEVSAAPVRDAEGRISRAVAVVRDVTEQVAAAEHLRASEKLRALGQLAAGTSHDLNNVLAMVLGHAELLLRADLPAPVRDTVQTIYQAAEDGAQVVRRLQDFARVRTQRPSERVELAAVVRDAVEVTRPRWQDDAQARGVTITIEQAVDERLAVVGSAAELREVLTNLIMNAVDALPRGGHLAVCAQERAGRARLVVADTGVGMDEETRRRCFEPFWTTKGERGSGLGLAMVAALVERHGGTIEVESAAERGTSFTISLPLCPAAASPPDPAAGPPAPASLPPARLRVLVVDDEPGIARLLQQMLQVDGHEVAVALGGAAAIAALEKECFDVVFSDISMPSVNGWEVTRVAHSLHPNLPVVLVTGWGAQVDADKLKQAGVACVVSKPFRSAEIRAALEQATRRDCRQGEQGASAGTRP